jgi:hypothetical protein
MEKTKEMTDVVRELLDRGYSLSFEALEQARDDWGEEIDQPPPARKFLIDGVYRCRDGSADIIYIFAISSTRYNMKSIVINAIAAETGDTLRDIFQKIKGAFAGLLGIE